METGCSPYYRWFYRESALVKNTRFADLYACHYRDWLPDALKLYREANLVLGGLQDKLIVGHERLMAGVYRTTYDNGWAVVVNYGGRAVVVDGIAVKARDYALPARGAGEPVRKRKLWPWKLTLSQKHEINGYAFTMLFTIGFVLFFLYPFIESVIFSLSTLHMTPDGYRLSFSGIRQLSPHPARQPEVRPRFRRVPL